MFGTASTNTVSSSIRSRRSRTHSENIISQCRNYRQITEAHLLLSSFISDLSLGMSIEFDGHAAIPTFLIADTSAEVHMEKDTKYPSHRKMQMKDGMVPDFVHHSPNGEGICAKISSRPRE